MTLADVDPAGSTALTTYSNGQINIDLTWERRVDIIDDGETLIETNERWATIANVSLPQSLSGYPDVPTKFIWRALKLSDLL